MQPSDSAMKAGWGAVKDQPRFYHLNAELAATRVEFLADFHFGVDEWFNHRVEAEIANIDSVWYGGSRQWQVYSFLPSGGPYGIQLVDQGAIPALAPGQTHAIKLSLPSTVSFQAAYVLVLSAGDPDRSNDIAVDTP